MSPRKIVFIFDRAAHYHRELFVTLERELGESGAELFLLSGSTKRGAGGRTGVADHMIVREFKYPFREIRLGSYTIRTAASVIGRIREIEPAVVVATAHVGDLTQWRLIGAKRTMGFKLVAWQCGYEYNPGRLKARILGRFMPGFDYHLAYHSNAQRYALQHGARPDQVSVMHNTINEGKIEVISKDAARSLVATNHPEIGARRILLFVGAVLKEKRIESILEALDLLRRDDVVLLLVGDGEHMPAIREACANRNDVILTGAITDGVRPYFDAAEMYLLPGTGGLGINEAMAHRLPIISGYADGSADDLVVDNENGFRLREGTAEELAGRIGQVLDDPDLAARMGATSRAWITGKFSFRSFIDHVKKTLLAV